jgi:two-component system, NtrC family, sensor histidine kinase KinB
MTLKTKIVWGLAFLFLIIFGLVGVCSYYVGRLGEETNNILKDNYYSVGYARSMLSSLDDMSTAVASALPGPGGGGAMSAYYGRTFDSGRTIFELNLKSENGNITEIHEKEYVEALNKDYDSYLKLCLQIKEGQGGAITFDTLRSAGDRLRHTINAIYDVNMQAVVRKSQLAGHDSSRFVTSMAIIGSICILLALVYFWYFPVYISTTISYLAERMKKLVKGAGITFDMETKDEAFIILHGIGLLENKLGVRANNGK